MIYVPWFYYLENKNSKLKIYVIVKLDQNSNSFQKKKKAAALILESDTSLQSDEKKNHNSHVLTFHMLYESLFQIDQDSLPLDEKQRLLVFITTMIKKKQSKNKNKNTHTQKENTKTYKIFSNITNLTSCFNSTEMPT